VRTHEDSRERANALAAAWRQSEQAFHDRRREEHRVDLEEQTTAVIYALRDERLRSPVPGI
jgi:hypothetical protein